MPLFLNIFVVMKCYGLIGYPLGHSFSAGYFTKRFSVEGIDASYDNYPIESIELLSTILSPQMVGFNVTIPYKEQVMCYLDEIDTQAQEIGAVNCVKVTYLPGYKGKCQENYHLKGYNSDVYGLELSLKEMIPATEPLSALVLGTGGAAKAAIYVLGRLNIPFKVVSRDRSKGDLAYEDITPEVMAQNRVIINTTPLGMSPKVEYAPELPYEAITDGHILFDLIYNPAQTLFLERGRAMGATVRSGYYMLVKQAELGYTLFNTPSEIL